MADNYNSIESMRAAQIAAAAKEAAEKSAAKAATKGMLTYGIIVKTPKEEDPLKEEVEIPTGKTKAEKIVPQARYAEAIIAFEGVDISDEINKYLISMSYQDNEEDEADDLQLKLQDVQGIWLRKWLDASMQASMSSGSISVGGKTKGLKIKAGIKLTLPTGEVQELNCGDFTLDSVKASGPPSVVTIKATSLPYTSGTRTEERNKSWENYSLSSIGKEIAGKSGMGFFYDSNVNPLYSRVEQTKKTDISFLQELCHNSALSLKISSSKMVVFQQSEYEKKDPIAKVSWMDGTYTKYDLSTVENDTTYSDCEVQYSDPDSKKTIFGSAKSTLLDAESNNKQKLRLTDYKVSSVAEAKSLAESMLKLHNKYERECSFTLIGNPLLSAGMTMEVEGFGLWDGKYIISECKHEISGVYTTKIKLRGVNSAKKNTSTSTSTSSKTSKSDSGSYTGRTDNTSKNQSDDSNKRWGLTCSASIFDRPPSEGGSIIGSASAGTYVTLLGSTSGGYTLVNAGGTTGYVSTGALGKI